jgi:hypothetical protein
MGCYRESGLTPGGSLIAHARAGVAPVHCKKGEGFADEDAKHEFVVLGQIAETQAPDQPVLVVCHEADRQIECQTFG